jgi:hypothetical protein
MSKKKFVDADVFSAMAATSVSTQPPMSPQPTATLYARQLETTASRRSTESGLPAGVTRATIIVPVSLLEKCRDIAYWERLRDQDVYAAALSAYISTHEKQMGRPVESRPSHARRSKNN